MGTGDGPPAAADGTPDRQLAGMSQVGARGVEPTPELVARRDAIADLGDALRELTASAIDSEVDVEEVRRVAGVARELAAALDARRRRPGEPSSVDDLRRGQRLFNPVVGVGNPVAPPMRVQIADGVAIGTCTLDARYEGPITFAHGGVSAMLLDQIMGYAAASAGHPSVTGRLEVRFRTAVPLGRPLQVEARLIDVLGVRAALTGSISLAAAPDDPLVTAEGRFLALRREQATRLFGDVAGRSD
jgi:acyl-coenzyme A thioesterase PaaI-like protein